jgi:hypothetical protein
VKKPCFVCGVPVQNNTMCPEHLAQRQRQQRKPDNRPSRQDRGYDAEYERNRKIMVENTRRNNWPCWICHQPFSPNQVITAEHIIPKRRGGTNALENLAPAHSWCNSGWRRRRRRA